MTGTSQETPMGQRVTGERSIPNHTTSFASNTSTLLLSSIPSEAMVMPAELTGLHLYPHNSGSVYPVLLVEESSTLVDPYEPALAHPHMAPDQDEETSSTDRPPSYLLNAPHNIATALGHLDLSLSNTIADYSRAYAQPSLPVTTPPSHPTAHVNTLSPPDHQSFSQSFMTDYNTVGHSSSTWYNHNILLNNPTSNASPTSTQPSSSPPTTTTYPNYLNTTHPQLSSWVYQTSNHTLSFPEWSLNKYSNWDVWAAM